MTLEENQAINEQFNSLYKELFDCGDDPKKCAKIQKKIDKLNADLLASLPESPLVKVKQSVESRFKELGFTDEEIQFILKSYN